MQVFYTASGRREPIVGVVGALQLDVITSRLRSEYGVDVSIDPATFTAARWVADPRQSSRWAGKERSRWIGWSGRSSSSARRGSSIFRAAASEH